MQNEKFKAGMDVTTAEIARLISCLESLREGDQVVDLIAAYGEKAIPYLRKYLMEGQPSHIYQPRQLAVFALARLGAREVLIEYLRKPKKIPDPAFRFGEEAVESTAARNLAVWHTDDVFEFLQQIAASRTLPGVIEALGSFQNPKSIPFFIGALLDDMCRPAAENALKAMGDPAIGALIEAAAAPRSSESTENPSMLLRRRTAMRLLADGEVPRERWPNLKACLSDSDPVIAVSAARIALEIADCEDQRLAIEALLGNIPHAGWYVQTEIESCLVKHYDIAKDAIAARIEKGEMRPKQEQNRDCVFLTLLNVRKRIGRTETEKDPCIR